ncbi:MAG TPA: glycosyltransferase family 4 protein [Thermoanaerobaculia bacterium]|jgi:glycosyltransferase involved in cell wall biosynthesis|nr:glycosyltransferase family 4 protein [Thermoanaerobaculia bacterium]
MNLDYVSPLPPVRSGIADYSVDLLPHLAGIADLRLIRLPGLPVDPGIERRWPMAPAEETGKDGRLPLYQMGNNRYHAGVLDLAMRLPGVLTLHDVFLHHLLQDVTLGRQEPSSFWEYKDRLTRDHGWIGEAAALAKRWNAWGNAPLFSLPAHRSLLRRQRGVLVHSEWAASYLAEEDLGVPVRAVPMGIPLPPEADEAAGRALRERFGLPLDRPVLGSFGFQTPIKRTVSVVKALAAPGLEDVHLLIVGEAAGVMDLEGEARRAGVADRVHILGFVPFKDFEAAIAAVDLCLNLRYPTAGETSASLLRVLAAGRPALVSDYAQFGDFPPEIALRVPLGDEEPEALAALVRELLAQPGRLRAMGRAAREHVRLRHDPALAARAVVEACGDFAGLEPPGDDPGGRPEVPPPSSLGWWRLPGEIQVEGADLPWPEGERRRVRIRLRNTSGARWLAGERGPGGISIVVKIQRDHLWDVVEERPWLSLPHDLAPGEEISLETDVRRPPGPAFLSVEPHLFGDRSLSFLGGPLWERWI